MNWVTVNLFLHLDEFQYTIIELYIKQFLLVLIYLKKIRFYIDLFYSIPQAQFVFLKWDNWDLYSQFISLLLILLEEFSINPEVKKNM